jgi:hypothetical protein
LGWYSRGNIHHSQHHFLVRKRNARSGFISIWFFIGVLLSAYGVLITGTGIYELFARPSNAPVLFDLHASIWWGVVLLMIGLIYFIRFLPEKLKSRQSFTGL